MKTIPQIIDENKKLFPSICEKLFDTITSEYISKTTLF